MPNRLRIERVAIARFLVPTGVVSKRYGQLFNSSMRSRVRTRKKKADNRPGRTLRVVDRGRDDDESAQRGEAKHTVFKTPAGSLENREKSPSPRSDVLFKTRMGTSGPDAHITVVTVHYVIYARIRLRTNSVNACFVYLFFIRRRTARNL